MAIELLNSGPEISPGPPDRRACVMYGYDFAGEQFPEPMERAFPKHDEPQTSADLNRETITARCTASKRIVVCQVKLVNRAAKMRVLDSVGYDYGDECCRARVLGVREEI